MPRYWYDPHTNNQKADEAGVSSADFIGTRLLADRKPYFMRYIYPDLAKQYNTYVRNANVKCIREFRMDITELLDMPESELNEDQAEFISYYKSRLPVGNHDCVMNRICRRFECEFDRYVIMHPAPEEFDCSILKSGVEYPYSQRRAIEKLYAEYCKQVEQFCQDTELSKTDDEYIAHKDFMLRDMRVRCMEVCSDLKQLCDIVVDICYHKNSTKQFAWDICGNELVENLLNNNGRMINYATRDEAGDIEFNGIMFSMKQKEVPAV